MLTPGPLSGTTQVIDSFSCPAATGCRLPHHVSWQNTEAVPSIFSPDHALRGTFLHVTRADACRRSVWRDRCEATRDAARSGLICRVGGSSGHTAPRLMGLTA